MITQEQFDTEVKMIISNAIREDVGDGDHSSLACIPENARGKAKLLVKDKGIIGGVNFAKKVFAYVDKNLKLDVRIEDGTEVTYGDIVMYVEGSSQSILKAERTVLNAMQRMSAIATKTRMFVDLVYDCFYKNKYEYTQFLEVFREEYKDFFTEEEMRYTYAD